MTKPRKRIFVTGGAGFIGTNLVNRLIDEDAGDVVVVDNESAGSTPPGEKAWPRLGVEYHRGDFAGSARLMLHGTDVLIHLAAATGVADSIRDHRFTTEVNVERTLLLLDAAREARVQRVIFASSGGAVVGSNGPVADESCAPRPMSPYGASKLAVEAYCSAFEASYGMSIACLRFANVYGPFSWHKGSIIPRLCRKALGGSQLVLYGDGRQMRDFVYVDDVVDAIMRAMDSRHGGVFHVGTGTPTTVLEVIEAVSKASGVELLDAATRAPAREGEVYETWCAIERARRDLGWSPGISLYDGIRRTWRWFQEFGGGE